MYKIQLARLGQTMEQGTIVRWLKQEGEPVQLGEELYEIETEKAIVPVQATRDGVLVKVIEAEGSTVPVGALLAIAAEPGEEVSPEQVEALTSSAAQASDAEDSSTSVADRSGASASSTRTTGGRVAAAPKARVLARELGVDLAEVSGTGPGGMIVPEDVRRAADSAPNAGASAGASDVETSPIVRAMMRAVEKSWQIPQFTQIKLIDASNLLMRREAASGVSLMDLFLDALVSAARQTPQVLASVHEGELRRAAGIDLTIATATDSGLLMPVLRDAGSMTLQSRSERWRALVEKARKGALSPDESSGGVLAISNLGMRGVDTGTPLLPAGHALIAFFGALEQRPLVIDGQVQARPSVYLSITYDHRFIDGALAARFTSAMSEELQRERSS